MRELRRDSKRDFADAVGVGMQQVAGLYFHAANTDGLMHRGDVAVAMRAYGAVTESGEAEAAHLVEIARRTAGDDAERAEALVAGAHHFAERGADRRVIDVLEDDDRGAGQLREAGNLGVE